ncbi:MAG: NAD-dependent deacylase [Alistipes sp.]|nr:NAD-dependent deacylase [Alistipes sp.]
MARKNIVVFTGAGVSADSGIATFRDADGLWANYRIEEVCTPEALKNNRAKVIEFYNMRRRESLTKQPNDGHRAIASMEEWADVCVVTQNVDNLHEQAGSSRVLHLHGELMKLRSEQNPDLIYDINEGWEQDLDARGEDGALLRPHIVFFGESVPMFDAACKIVEHADILVVVGTSLAVYPAAMLVYYVRDKQVPIYLVDPGTPDTRLIKNPLTHIKERGAVGLPQLVEQLKNEFGE